VSESVITHTGHTRLAGVIGWPVSHSLSPRIHGFWLKELGIDGAYVPFPVKPGAVEEAITGLVALGIAGANVTVPHKEAVIPVMDELDQTARRLGAVNTIVVDPGGRLIGRNSDGYGFLENLYANAPDWSAKLGPATVLGAGGAARAIVGALLDAGAPEIRLVNRTRSRAESIAEDFGDKRVIAGDWTAMAIHLESATLLVNTTSLGMKGQPPLEIDLSSLPSDAVVNDIVYVPLETELLKSAKARGNPTVDGVGMLLHQARLGFTAWFGGEPLVTDALRNFVLGS
jgi:shikimate dehydrogenase